MGWFVRNVEALAAKAEEKLEDAQGDDSEEEAREGGPAEESSSGGQPRGAAEESAQERTGESAKGRPGGAQDG